MGEYKKHTIIQVGQRYRVHLEGKDVYNSLSLADCKAWIDIVTYNEAQEQAMISLGIKEKTPEVETKIPKVVYSEAAHINTPEMQELYEKNLEIEKNNIKPPKEPGVIGRPNKLVKALTTEEILQREKIKAMLRTSKMKQ